MKSNAVEKPHVSEKATLLAEQGIYVFKAARDANKREVKKEIEDKFNVDVLYVRMSRVPQKKRRVGRIEGIKPAYKKAIVKIKEGQSIEIT